MVIDCPRIAFCALRGNSGKTLLTVGTVTCLHNEGREISPFKKGPDYIDAAWLALAAGRPCYNLDVFLMERRGIFSSFSFHTNQADGAIVEGNRGIFDGLDEKGTYSSAELAKMLGIPVILIVDCKMTTRTVAAMVLGCQHFDLDVAIKGVVLNRIRGSRHGSIIKRAIEENCGIPVLGQIPNIEGRVFPERHMGLVPPQEHPGAKRAIDEASKIADQNVDIEGVWKIATSASSLNSSIPDYHSEKAESGLYVSKKPRIGYIRDAAFWFYYPDNIEALEYLGAEMVECNGLVQDSLPSLDALYIGGGFPETHAEVLAANIGFRRALQGAIERGLPVYAECGGLLYLGERLIIDGKEFPMAGVFPLTFVLERRPQAHGYTVLEVIEPNPYFFKGEILHGHEFHYSRIIEEKKCELTLAFEVKRGYGIDGMKDGLCYKNVLATYSHVHASGASAWAKGLFGRAVQYSQDSKREKDAA
ncbi:MAG: cobyrinate a,c-diamide synthase [Thermodesulfobacteriota bacterium]|nr:cobyrinate a,c-diamide synthase [Thermodesulfobacteriota bacterium]